VPPETQPDHGRRADIPARPPGRRTGRLLGRPELAVTLAGLALFGWQVGTASPWRDEAATFAAARRPLGELFALVRTVDLVHLAYYLLAHAVLTVHDSLTAVRLVSVLAMALTAGAITALGRRMASPAVGLAAGAALVVAPLASRWAQDARSYALVTLVATVSTGALVAAVRRPGRSVWWLAYAASLPALAALNLISLLLVTAHLSWLLLTQPVRRLRVWLIPTAVALLGSVPFLVLAFRQRAQVGWILPPTLSDLALPYVSSFGTRVVPVLVTVLAVVVLVLGRGLPGGALGQAFVLGAVWSTVPTLTLWLVSQLLPMWDQHYLLFTLPGLTLTVAAGAGSVVDAALRLRRRGQRRTGRRTDRQAGRLVAGLAGGLVAVLAGLGMPDQVAVRDARTGHDEDVRGVAAYLRQQARPGDGVVFVRSVLREIRWMYPQDFTGLEDLALAADPGPSGTLTGTEVSAQDLPARMAGRKRIWLVTKSASGAATPSATDRAKLALLAGSYREVDRRQLTIFSVVLYQALAPGQK
jgi:mannosyltransferase